MVQLPLILLLGVATAHATHRVVLVQDSRCLTGRAIQPECVRVMIATGLQSLTGQTNEQAAWRQLVSPSDVVGIKISAQAAPLHQTHQAVLDALVTGLQSAGIPAAHIHIFDRDPQKLRAAGYTGLPVSAIIGATGWDPDAFIDNKLVGKLIWGDLEFGKDEPLSTRSHLPKLVTQAITKLINVPALMDHEAAGLAGALYNVTVGMADNTRRFEQPGFRPDPAVIELLDRPEIRDKLILNVTDALIAGYAGGPNFKPQYSWPHAGLYFSRDPVALDAVCLELLEAQRHRHNLPPIGDRASHIPAAGKTGLGQADRAAIEFQQINLAP